MYKRIFVAGVLIFVLAVASQANIIQTEYYNGHTYYLLEQSTWTDAEAEAVTLGGHLATINDAGEDAWVFNSFAQTVVDRLTAANGDADFGSLWIGYQNLDYATDPDNIWEWISGESSSYTNWLNGQPTNSAWDIYAESVCGVFVSDWYQAGASGMWHDIVNPPASGVYDYAYGVVEVSSIAVPAPGALLLAGIGTRLAGRFRRMGK